jgi:hypothetical protein
MKCDRLITRVVLQSPMSVVLSSNLEKYEYYRFSEAPALIPGSFSISAGSSMAGLSS